jgi:hypothetical protein
MDRQEALRKITLLRRITQSNGASSSEAATAARKAEELMVRYVGESIGHPERSAPIQQKAVSTEPWARLLDEFGFRLSTFGGRCSAGLNRNARLLIRADQHRWEVQQRSPEGWKPAASGTGFSSLREYLTKNTTRRYTLAG